MDPADPKEKDTKQKNKTLDVPICVECKHCHQISFDDAGVSLVPTFYKCKHPKTVLKNPVTGELIMQDCSQLRIGSIFECGAAGYLWEAKTIESACHSSSKSK